MCSSSCSRRRRAAAAAAAATAPPAAPIWASLQRDPALPGRKVPHLDIPKPHLIPVVLQGDVASWLAVVVLGFGPLALGDGLLELVAHGVHIYDLEAVEPVLDMRALDDDLRVIPLSGRPRDVERARDDVVHGPRPRLGLLA